MTTVEIQGQKRKYTVVAPENPGPNLLPFLHGSLQNGSVLRRFTAGTFDELAERTGTVVKRRKTLPFCSEPCRKSSRLGPGFSGATTVYLRFWP